MRIQALPMGGYRVSDGTDRIELDCLAYEDLFCALPLETPDLEIFLTDFILVDERDRATLARMIARSGGSAAAMSALHAEIMAHPPSLDSAGVSLPESAPLPPAAATGQRTILLVEPNDWNARTVEERLRGTDFHIAARARRVDEALEQYRKQRTDLVVLDLTAPGAEQETVGGGLDPVRRFLDVNRQCALVVTYTYETKARVAPAVRAGASGHLQKPFERADLLALLTKALTSRTSVPAPRGQVVKRTIACAWKPETGLLASWKDFPGRSIDMKGLDGSLPEKMKEGTRVRLKLELPGAKRPLESAAEVASCHWDSALKAAAVRFAFLNPSLDAVQALAGFLNQSTRRK